MTNPSRIEKLRQQREALDKKIRELAARSSATTRKMDERRKIIIGGWVLKHRPNLVKEIVANGLERKQDIAAFADWQIDPEPNAATAQDGVKENG